MNKAPSIFERALMPEMPESYIGTDGLHYCKKCGTAMQLRNVVPELGIDSLVWIPCECAKREHEEEHAVIKDHQNQFIRKSSFDNPELRKCTFAVDDMTNSKLSSVFRKYAENFPKYLKQGRGLVLAGNCGTGKTFYAACIANALIDSGYEVKVTNFATLINEIQGTYQGKNDIIRGLNKYPLLVIDDLGAERNSEFMLETVWNIVDSRYNSGLPLIVTTNLTLQELHNPGDIRRDRIYDRILEVCFPVPVTGKSRRKETAKKMYDEMRKELGL